MRQTAARAVPHALRAGVAALARARTWQQTGATAASAARRVRARISASTEPASLVSCLSIGAVACRGLCLRWPEAVGLDRAHGLRDAGRQVAPASAEEPLAVPACLESVPAMHASATHGIRHPCPLLQCARALASTMAPASTAAATAPPPTSRVLHALSQVSSWGRGPRGQEGGGRRRQGLVCRACSPPDCSARPSPSSVVQYN